MIDALHTIEIIVLLYIIFIVVYNLIFVIASLNYPNKLKKTQNFSTSIKFAVLVPAYKEDTVILNSVKQNLLVDYPNECFDLIVIADQLKSSTLKELNGTDAITHEVKFEKSTKAKAISSALEKYTNYTHVVILDADNIMSKDFLSYLAFSFENGSVAIQGRRKAKNVNTPYSVLDGISEEISNTIFRQGAEGIGVSSPIAGSGMAFSYELIYQKIKDSNAIGGFDKEFQIEIVKDNAHINYVKEAYVYDEKTEDLKVFENQRKRWISSHFIFLKRYFTLGIKSLFKGKFDLFHMAVLIQAQLPRMFNLGMLMLLIVFSFVLSDFVLIPSIFWMVFLMLYMVTLLLAVPKAYFNKNLIYAILRIPKLLFTMLGILFKMKESKRTFIHTPHKNI
ncbi:glycosyltransferase family 2 protein [uncultured Marivirga sp.]|uniref:glycosyltransferase n=1 Tax=uncultured Marivirga sp. TaxID=1123707 RepID=UPI0030ECA478|tara:strand:- start:55173 stop:56351 length:1179 start_codon:yes stop_codon:yes gene_type:complete